jgi:DNA modification methylase
LAYSPGVAEPCLKIEKNKEDAYKYTAKGNLVAVISNGTAVLGLGDIGPEASKPVMEGKGLLFKIFADIDVFDIEVDAKDIDLFVQTVKAIDPTFSENVNKQRYAFKTKWNDPKRGTSVLRPEVSHRGGDSSHCHLCGAKRIDLQIGLEETPEQYIEAMVEVFRCVKDILADDGILWVNIGDSYASQGGGQVEQTVRGQQDYVNSGQKGADGVGTSRKAPLGFKPKDLIGIPWMLAFALRADGWYLRQDIIWHKPNPMPESVQDRCTKAHEYIFLLSKTQKYFYDNEAIKEPAHTTDESNRDRDASRLNNTPGRTRMAGLKTNHYEMKNKRSVWTVNTKAYSGAHFAVFPEELIEPCILAGTSQRGHCPKCGVRWSRITQRSKPPKVEDSKLDRFGSGKAGVHRKVGQAYQNWLNENPIQTIGWEANCDCDADPVADIVIDPFMGSGTTAQVAQQLGRKYLGCELNPDYKELQDRRVSQQSLELL